MAICCDRLPHKHGKDRQGYQRYKCPVCNRTFSDNPNPENKGGRPTIGEKRMTDAERQQRRRAKLKPIDPPENSD